jgi:hypothetical protein
VPQQGQQQNPSPEDYWKQQMEALPKYEPKSKGERLAAKFAAERERLAAKPLEQQVQQYQQQLTQIETQQRTQAAEFTRLLESGDVDGALKVRGLGVDFETLQHKLLVAQGALAPKDPHTAALEKRLAEFEGKERTRLEAQQREQTQQQQKAEYENDVREIKSEIEALPGMKNLASMQGFPETVLRTMSMNPGLTFVQATGIVRQQYATLAQNLGGAFNPSPAAQPGRLPAPAESFQPGNNQPGMSKSRDQVRREIAEHARTLIS